VRTFLRRYRRPLSIWTATAAVLLIVQHVASKVVREDPYRPWPLQPFEWYFGGWSQFDGPEYLRIATEGYSYTVGERSNIVWFPLYPNLVRLVDTVVSPVMASAILVALVAGACAAVVVWAWLAQQRVGADDGDRTRLLAWAAVFFYPYAWYLYGVVHSDALFLALVVGTFLLIERRHLVAAGLIGALATATRPTGMAVIPAAIVLSLERAGVLSVPEDATGIVARWQLPTHVDRSRLRAVTLAPLLAVLGLGTWMVYLGVKWGDPLAFQTNQRVYHPGNLPLLKRAFFVRWRDFEVPSYVLTITLQAILVLVVLCCIPAVIRRFGFGYGVYCAVLVAIPTFSTEDFMGTGRYLIAGFCVWALLGERLASKRWGWAPIVASGSLMAFMAMGFSRSWYLT
jgi:hypothetical protein